MDLHPRVLDCISYKSVDDSSAIRQRVKGNKLVISFPSAFDPLTSLSNGLFSDEVFVFVVRFPSSDFVVVVVVIVISGQESRNQG